MKGEHADVKPPSNGSEFWFCGCDEASLMVVEAGAGVLRTEGKEGGALTAPQYGPSRLERVMPLLLALDRQ
jgi:hypothetical protein